MDELMRELESIQEGIDAALESIDLSDENETITRYHDQLLDIRLGLEAITENDGVNRDIAASLEAYLPDDLPRNAFTRSFTHTNLDATVVSLEEKNWGIIAMIGIAIAGLIAKIIMWLFDRKGASASDSAAKVEKVAVANERAADSSPKDQRQEVEKKINDEVNGYWNAFMEACAIEPTRKMVDFFALEKDLYTNRSSSLIEDATLLVDVVSDRGTEVGGLSRAEKHLERQRKSISANLGYRGVDVREALERFEGELKELENQSGKPFSIASYNSLHSQKSGKPGIVAKIMDERDLDIDSHQSRDLKVKLEKLKERAERLKEESGSAATNSDAARKLAQARSNALRTVQDTLNVLTKYFSLRDKMIATDKKCQKDLLGGYKKALDGL
tara:strand:- start:6716 stop:7876 length:1161 start_codon:yes stop_codon:yes gene_type:complete